MLSRFSLVCVQLFATPWTVAHQAPLCIEFSRQEYWTGSPFPSPRDLPNPAIEPMSLVSPALAGRFFTTEPPGTEQITTNGNHQFTEGNRSRRKRNNGEVDLELKRP